MMKHGPAHGRRATFCRASHHRKIRYKNRNDAGIARATRIEQGEEYLRIYQCGACGGFHLTSQERLAV